MQFWLFAGANACLSILVSGVYFSFKLSCDSNALSVNHYNSDFTLQPFQ